MPFQSIFNFATGTAATPPSAPKAAASATVNQQVLKSNAIDDEPSPFYDALISFLPNRLYFNAIRTMPASVPDDAHIFSIDNDFAYVPFYADFGPVNIANVYRFCELMAGKMADITLKKKRLVLLASAAPDKCTNAVFLLCAYMLLTHNQLPEQAYRPILEREQTLPLAQFRDAGYGPATYWLTVPDLLVALQKGVKEAKLIDWDHFDIEQYEFFEKVENGDLNWIIPGFFLAMATPHDEAPIHLVRYHEQVKAGLVYPLHPKTANSKRFKPVYEIHALMDYLKSVGITGVVRLNNKVYERNTVLNHGLDHYELYFPDGSVPPWDTIVKKFMHIADLILPLHLINDNEAGLTKEDIAQRGALAVHCKAGLGRTGTLICCWMIKTFGWTARECIAWCRIVRPGSVVGPQQNWLESMEERLLKWGEEERAGRRSGDLLKPAPLTRSEHPDLGSELGLPENNGTEALADQANGMIVPIQPNKYEREEAELVALEQEAETRPYNLRSKDGTTAGPNSKTQ